MKSRVMGFKRMDDRLARRFKTTFGRNLFNFWSIMDGFNLIAFDEVMTKTLKVKEGMSLSDAIKKEYGPAAVILINQLIDS